MLPLHLDMLVIAAGLHAGDLAMTRLYLQQLREMPNARGIDVHVITNGNPFTSGLSPQQLERRLRPLPVIARLVRALEQSADALPPRRDELDIAFAPLIEEILARRQRDIIRSSPVAPALSHPASAPRPSRW
jgi:hypothetical protein